MLNETSIKRLSTVKEKLRMVVVEAVATLPFDVMVVEGLRSKERQIELYAQGRTKPGKMVTWTLDSKHITGDAVDLAPMAAGVILWEDKAKFTLIKVAMMRTANRLGIGIRWGGDWDQDNIPFEKGETDLPHFELTGKDVNVWVSKPLSESLSQPSRPSLASKPTEPKKDVKLQMPNAIKLTWLDKLIQLIKPLKHK